MVVFLVMLRDFSGDIVLTHLRRGWVFTFLGLSFTLCTVHVWTAIYSFTFFMLGAGVWLIAAAREDDNDQTPVAVAPKGPVFARDFNTTVAAPTAEPLRTADRNAPRFSRFSGPDDT